MCLYSVTNGGLDKKIYDEIRIEILQTYGYENIITLENLEKVELLIKSNGKNNYKAISKKLKLTLEDVDVEEDISYTYSGYAPLSVRLVEELKENGNWNKIKPILELIPGITTSL